MDMSNQKGSGFSKQTAMLISPTTLNELPSFAFGKSRDTFWSELMRRDLCLFENLTHAGPEADPFWGMQKIVGKMFGEAKQKIHVLLPSKSDTIPKAKGS